VRGQLSQGEVKAGEMEDCVEQRTPVTGREHEAMSSRRMLQEVKPFRPAVEPHADRESRTRHAAFTDKRRTSAGH